MGYEVDFLAGGDENKSGDAIALRFGNLYGERAEQTVIVIDGGFNDDGQKIINLIKKYYNGTDTIDIDIANGEYEHSRIRLWGIDTPETKHPKVGVVYFGPEAADFTTKLALGKQVTVYLEEHRTRGKFGRLLAYVQLPDSRFLNKVLLSEGFAYADTRFRHSLYYTYKQLEAAARSQKKGLWPDVTREQQPEWRRE